MVYFIAFIVFEKYWGKGDIWTISKNFGFSWILYSKTSWWASNMSFKKIMQHQTWVPTHTARAANVYSNTQHEQQRCTPTNKLSNVAAMWVPPTGASVYGIHICCPCNILQCIFETLFVGVHICCSCRVWWNPCLVLNYFFCKTWLWSITE